MSLLDGVSQWQGDTVAVRERPIGTLNCRLPVAHPTCTICGCDCTLVRVEFYGFAAIGGPGSYPIEYVLITTCMEHWHEPLAVRLRAVA